MNSSHATEEQLQQYALGDGGQNSGLSQHIESCATCLAAVDGYRQMFAAIAEQAPPVFSFDVAEMVVAALPEKRRSVFPYLLSAILIAAIAIPGYLLKDNLVNLFARMSHFFLYAAIAASAVYLGTNIAGIF